MPPEDIESPPYPSESTAPGGLYNALSELKNWVEKYRDAMNAAVGQEIIPSVKPLADRSAYIYQPVLSLFSHLVVCRRIRERWDHLVRTYESSWDEPMCVRQRALLLQSATLMLNSATTPVEYRETRRQLELEELQQMFSRVQTLLDKAMESDRHDPLSEG